jgi:hypothetical protein
MSRFEIDLSLSVMTFADSPGPDQDYRDDKHETQDAEVAARALLSSVEQGGRTPPQARPPARIKSVSSLATITPD